MKLSDVDPKTLTQVMETLIANGHFDDQLDHLIEASIQRKKWVRNEMARRLRSKIRIGDQVQISKNIKPRYMAGQVGKVTGFRQTKVVVEFPVALGRFGRSVIIPLSTLTLLETPDVEVEID